MKRLLILLSIFISSITAYAQPECPMDSIGGGGAGVGSLDQSVIQLSPTYCTECPANGVVSWELPNDFNGHVYLHSPNGQQAFSIQVVKDCRYVMLDTCLVLPNNPSNGAFDLTFAIIGGVQLYVSGQVGDTVAIDCKSTPSPQEELTMALIDLQLCQIPTTIDAPLTTCEQSHYINITTLIEYTERSSQALPSGIYWQYCTDRRVGKKILIP